MHKVRAALLFAAIGLLAACASKPPLDTGGVNSRITPAQASANLPQEARVVWGGVIVQTTNLKDATQIEVVGFPLNDKQEPRTDTQPIGRFLILQPGYLESAEYASGRRLTVVGPVTGRREGRIGETLYNYPLVAPEKMHLWPVESYGRSNQTQFHFGIGVGAVFH